LKIGGVYQGGERVAMRVSSGRERKKTQWPLLRCAFVLIIEKSQGGGPQKSYQRVGDGTKSGEKRDGGAKLIRRVCARLKL